MGNNNLPTGKLQTEITIDGNKLYLEYEIFNSKGQYIITDNFNLYYKGQDLNISKMCICAMSLVERKDYLSIIKYVKVENKRLPPLISILRGLQWDTEACRFNEVVNCAINRLEGNGKITKHK